MSRAYTSWDREFVREIVAGEGVLDLYCLHEKYKLSPAQVSDTVSFFLESGVVKRDGRKAILTAYGWRWLFKNRKALLFRVDKSSWKEPQVEKVYDEAYRPKVSRIAELRTAEGNGRDTERDSGG